MLDTQLLEIALTDKMFKLLFTLAGRLSSYRAEDKWLESDFYDLLS